jgi:hypothetical protein
MARVSAALGVYESVLSDEKLDSIEGRRKAAGWAGSHEALSGYLKRSGAGPEQARLSTRGFVLADLLPELMQAQQRAGVDQDGSLEWITRTATIDGLSAFPYLGRVEEVVYHRFRNPQDTWEENDLLDIHPLTCAAGYADVVVGENKTSDYLNRATRRVPAGARVCAKLPQAVEHLDATLAEDEQGNRS